MYGNNELKNYWEDNKKVLKAESEALEELKKNNKKDTSNNHNEKSSNQINLNFSNTENTTIKQNSINKSKKNNDLDYTYIKFEVAIHIAFIISLFFEYLWIIGIVVLSVNFVFLWVSGIFKVFLNDDKENKIFWLLGFVFFSYIAALVYPAKKR